MAKYREGLIPCFTNSNIIKAPLAIQIWNMARQEGNVPEFWEDVVAVGGESRARALEIAIQQHAKDNRIRLALHEMTKEARV